MRSMLMIFILFYCSCGLAATLSYRQSGPDSFELLLENEAPLEIDQAQSSIYPSAIELCAGKKPLFGKYSFQGDEPLADGSEGSSFTFLQIISCVDEVVTVVVPAELKLSNLQEKAIKDRIKVLTEEFLSAKESGDFQKAYTMLDPGMQSVAEFAVWRSNESNYSEETQGKLISRDIWRITVYNNPPGSPKPGFYIAADYENSYEKSPVHCGYLMWYLPSADSSNFLIMREEYGNIPADILNKIPNEKLQSIRNQLGCRSN